MCGIIGYIGNKPAAAILVEGLKALEYRGYDNAGLATVEAKRLAVRKVGEKDLTGLWSSVESDPLFGTVGIGHTRWATHGDLSIRNAHPHVAGRVAVVHNGIIENHEALRGALCSEGRAFESHTDTEVLPHLIDREIKRGANSFETAVAQALTQVEGAYAVAVLSPLYPDELVAACNSSPLVIGIGQDELYVASDELAFAGKATDGVVHVRDGEVVTLKRNGSYRFRGMPLSEVRCRVERPALPEAVHKGGFEHYMRKEIHEQPQTLRNALSHLKGERISFGGLTGDIEARLADSRRIVLVGCGTSLFAAMVGKRLIEECAGVMCEAEQAAEFAYARSPLSSADTVIGISQSGETADTLRAMARAKERHALCLGITNRVGSALAKQTRLGMYLHAGPEIAVASTKAFTSQVTLLALFALRLSQLRGGPVNHRLLRGLKLLPGLAADELKREEEVKTLAVRWAAARRLVVIGRGYTLPLALEAALKVREVAYLDAHGLSAAELKHGTLALVEPGVPVLGLMPHGELQPKMRSNLEEAQARGGDVCLLEAPVYLPDALLPMVLALRVQLLAYHLGVARGVDVDQPRNLAKSVTVE